MWRSLLVVPLVAGLALMALGMWILTTARLPWAPPPRARPTAGAEAGPRRTPMQTGGFSLLLGGSLAVGMLGPLLGLPLPVSAAFLVLSLVGVVTSVVWLTRGPKA